MGKRISHEVKGDELNPMFAGYVFKITGGIDKQGVYVWCVCVCVWCVYVCVCDVYMYVSCVWCLCDVCMCVYVMCLQASLCIKAS